MYRLRYENEIRRQRRALRTVSGDRGSVLVLVLVVVALLSLGAYTFAEFMIVEAEATATYGREVQAQAAAMSGVEQAASLMQFRYDSAAPSLYNSPQYFEGILVRDSQFAKARCRVSVVSSAEQDATGHAVRYGLTDESAKLNLNALAAWVAAKTITPAQAETMLTNLSPDMTPDIADAILDWMDTDQTAMVGTGTGAEIDYYQGLIPPYPTKDNFLDTLDELLLVKGVTPTLLFGEDANHNGILDPNEDDGANSLPLDNADGMLQRGLSQFLTVYSRENNLQPDGTPRININQSDLTLLHQAVSSKFDSQTAKFIIAYRLGGSPGGAASGASGGASGGSSKTSTGGTSKTGSTGGSSGGATGGSSSKTGGGSSSKTGGSGTGGGMTGGSSGTGGTGGGSKTSGGSTGSTGGASGGSGGGTTGSSSGGSKSASASKTSGGNSAAVESNLLEGMDISGGGSVTVKSLYELFGATASVKISNTSTTLQSPWANTSADLSANALKVMQTLTLTDTPYIDGRINVNMAPREVLLGLPNLTPDVVDNIVGTQTKTSAGASSSFDEPLDRQTTAWLVISNLVPSSALQKLDPFITARGDALRLQSVGYFDGGGPMARIEAVIDASQVPPQVVFMRDLTEQGRGFTSQFLSTGSGASR